MSVCEHSELRRGNNGNWFCIGPDCTFEVHESVAQRTDQPAVDSRVTVEVALHEAERCRRYLDPVLNEMVTVALADEVIRMRAALRMDAAQAEADARFDQALQAAGAPVLPLEVYDSNSWRRVGLKERYHEIMRPCVQRDGHPDISGTDVLRALVAAFNAMLLRHPLGRPSLDPQDPMQR
jgi:hypothetical protein